MVALARNGLTFKLMLVWKYNIETLWRLNIEVYFLKIT